MSRRIWFFESPDRFIIGTVGVPGEREFFLQVRDGGEVRSFALEKSQAAALGERFAEILRELDQTTGASDDDADSLETPVDSEFTVGVMSISWRPESQDLLFEAQAVTHEGSADPIGELILDDIESAPDILRVTLDCRKARGFVKRTNHVVAAGRQPCIFCGSPINPGGHLCPRANGYRRT